MRLCFDAVSASTTRRRRRLYEHDARADDDDAQLRRRQRSHEAARRRGGGGDEGGVPDGRDESAAVHGHDDSPARRRQRFHAAALGAARTVTTITTQALMAMPRVRRRQRFHAAALGAETAATEAASRCRRSAHAVFAGASGTQCPAPSSDTVRCKRFASPSASRLPASARPSYPPIRRCSSDLVEEG